MGCDCSRTTGYERDIDQQMVEYDKKDRSKKKLLFLGSGSSGKSTLFKQLTRIYIRDEFDLTTQIDTLLTIRNNCIEQMIKLLRKQEDLMNLRLITPDLNGMFADGSIDMEEFVKHGRVLYQYNEFEAGEDFSDEQLLSLGKAVEYFWSLDSIKLTHSMRFHRFSFKENMEKFFDKVVDIFGNDYEVTTQDILMVRLRTTGMIEKDFSMMNQTVTVIDVGGQRSERQKWIHLFSGVDAILFVAALNHFNCVTFEDENINCMHDSLQLFDESINHKVLKSIDVILFLNKLDIFQELLKQEYSLSVCFGEDLPNWDGPYWTSSDYDYKQSYAESLESKEAEKSYFAECFGEAMEFIEERYKEKNLTPKRAIYVHPTTAVDKNNVQKVFWDVQNVAIRGGLYVGGIIT